MTVQNIVLIASVVGLLFSFYYIYTLDFKLRELKKEIKKQEEQEEQEEQKELEKEQNKEQNKEPLQDHKLTFSDQVICYNQKDNYSDSEISDMSIISENEANWIQDFDESSNPRPELCLGLKIEEFSTTDGKITDQEDQEDQEDQSLKELEELDPDAIEVISESSSEQVFPPNTCRVAIKTGPRKGKLCGKKTSGVPYCSRHGLYT